ncbi:MAG: hypothetical protein NVS4B12_15250 [Ktedonobacteraceae bacterium]
MNKKRTAFILSLGTIVALIIVAFLAVNFSTHRGASAQAPTTSTTLPVVKIIQTANGANFKTNKATTGQVAGQSGVKIFNGTTKGQDITLNGVSKVSIPPNESRTLSIGEGTFTFTLKSNSAAKLTVVGE